MRNQFRRFFPKGKFITNVLTSTTGAALAQAIVVLSSPIITRLYSPDDFGVLALFTSVTGVFSVIVCWRYEQAIVLPKKDKQAADILTLSMLIAFGMTFLTFIVMLFGRKKIAGTLDSNELSFWLWFVPLVVFSIGFNMTLNYWSIRRKKFKLLAISRISKSVIQIVVQIVAGCIIGTSVGGMIGGSIVGIVVASTVLGIPIWKDDFQKLLKTIKKSDVLFCAAEYRKFPYYDSWAALVNIISHQLPVLLLAYFFTPAVVGFYSLANRLLKLPTEIVAKSVRQVYYQKASNLYTSGRTMKGSFVKSTFGLLGVGIVPFSLVLLFGKHIFIFIFGDNWAIAGVYAQIISPWMLAKFLNVPGRTLYTVYQKQDVFLIFEILYFIFGVLSIFTGYYFFNSQGKSLFLFSSVGVIYNLWLIGYAYYYTRKKEQIS